MDNELEVIQKPFIPNSLAGIIRFFCEKRVAGVRSSLSELHNTRTSGLTLKQWNICLKYIGITNIVQMFYNFQKTTVSKDHMISSHLSHQTCISIPKHVPSYKLSYILFLPLVLQLRDNDNNIIFIFPH